MSCNENVTCEQKEYQRLYVAKEMEMIEFPNEYINDIDVFEEVLKKVKKKYSKKYDLLKIKKAYSVITEKEELFVIGLRYETDIEYNKRIEEYKSYQNQHRDAEIYKLKELMKKYPEVVLNKEEN